MWAQDPITLTFSGTKSNNVSVAVEGATGATATYEQLSNYGIITNGSKVTDNIICPSVNATANPEIKLRFTIQGLPTDFKFNTVGLFIHALASSGNAYQSVNENGANESLIRHWNIKVDLDGEDFANITDLDIAADEVQKNREIKANESKTTNGSLTLLLTITKGTTNPGCFFGLESITLSNVTPEDLINAAKAELQGVIDGTATITFGTSLGQYAENETYTSALAAAQSEIVSEEATLETIATAKTTLETAIAGLTLNMPQMGTFLRITGKISGKHLAAGNNNDELYRFNMTTATDASTVFYYDGQYLINLGSGLANGLVGNDDGYENGWHWVYGTDKASKVTFGDGNTNGGYSIQSSSAFFYDAGDTRNAADRGSSNNGNVRYNSWELAYVDELPIVISAVGYATLYSPVALAIPANSNLEVYTGIVNGNYLTLVELEGDIIPAQTAVILKGENSYNLEVTTGGKAVTDNALKGGLGMATEEGSILTLQQPTEADAIGFYSYTGAGLAGFKAYIETEAGIKGLTFDFGTTDGIATVEDATKEDAAIYNLAGQRVEKAVKGVYIINGKKVLVK